MLRDSGSSSSTCTGSDVFPVVTMGVFLQLHAVSPISPQMASALWKTLLMAYTQLLLWSWVSAFCLGFITWNGTLDLLLNVGVGQLSPSLTFSRAVAFTSTWHCTLGDTLQQPSIIFSLYGGVTTGCQPANRTYPIIPSGPANSTSFLALASTQ